ncbi:VWA domain-containing protein [candidate division KSB1 bacterium]|nr:VWA domain-containing protein [candidate division KSB1 bacterium]
MLRFAHPELLYIFFVIPALMLFYLYAFKAKSRAMKRFGNLILLQKLSRNTSRARQYGKIALLLSAVFFLVFALARPQIGTKLEEVRREGVDVIVAIDVSKSMLAEDIPPSRLDKAKHEVSSFIDRLRGDRIGLIAFAGDAFPQCPLTLDYGAAKIFLDILDPELIEKPGTSVGGAITQAIKMFEQKERKHKVLILITDGEDHGGKAVEIAEEAGREGIVIYCVGIGSPEGELIPLNNRGDYKRDSKGELVMTKLDHLTLEKIALQTNGKYYRASTGEEELDRIYDEIFKMEKKELGSLTFSQFEDRFQILVALAILLIVFETILPERRRIKQEWRGRFM